MNREDKIAAYIQQDAYAQHLGAKLIKIRLGYSCVQLTVTSEMTNFLGMTHGGVVFSLADMALAAASNSRGQTAVALNLTISYLKATKVGDKLQATAQEQHQGGPMATYDIMVTQQPNGEMVAKLQGTVYRKKEWFVQQE